MQSKERHTRIIAKIFLVLGVLLLTLTSFSFNFVQLAEEYLLLHFDDWDFQFGIFKLNHPPFGLLYIIPIFYFIVGMIDIIIGVGLLYGKRWARYVAMFIAVFMVFHPPIGTIFGVYILYQFLEGRDAESNAGVHEELNSQKSD